MVRQDAFQSLLTLLFLTLEAGQHDFATAALGQGGQ